MKDDHLRIVGYVETARDGKQRALDSRFRIVGYYDPASDQTKDARFGLFARAWADRNGGIGAR